ncbi:MAG: hypothetical protein VX498_07765 [Myxococcota bacterium]|nr:hypothetical protein [Myxococcota bacterium]
MHAESNGSAILSEPSAPDLRSLLGEADPLDLPQKQAWRALIRALRARKRSTGQASEFLSWAAVQRALSLSPRDPLAVPEIKRLLGRVLDGHDEAAIEVERLLTALLPTTASVPLQVDVRGWPEDFDGSLQARLLRREDPPPYCLAPSEAAALLREFDGQVLAGRSLRVLVDLPPGQVLPAVARSLRSRPMPRNRKGPWLPHWDEQGRRSLTSEVVAGRQARRLVEQGVTEIVDGCAGLGGNSIAFAREGLRVLAVEKDPARLALAQRNADALLPESGIEWRCGAIEALLPSLPPWHLFLDPPWHELNGELPPWLPLPGDRPVTLKLPHSFDPSVLPPRDWSVHYEFGEFEDDRAVLKMLTISAS